MVGLFCYHYMVLCRMGIHVHDLRASYVRPFWHKTCNSGNDRLSRRSLAFVTVPVFIVLRGFRCMDVS